MVNNVAREIIKGVLYRLTADGIVFQAAVGILNLPIRKIAVKPSARTAKRMSADSRPLKGRSIIAPQRAAKIILDMGFLRNGESLTSFRPCPGGPFRRCRKVLSKE